MGLLLIGVMEIKSRRERGGSCGPAATRDKKGNLSPSPGHRAPRARDPEAPTGTRILRKFVRHTCDVAGHVGGIMDW
jgi:hypothetical protein